MDDLTATKWGISDAQRRKAIRLWYGGEKPAVICSRTNVSISTLKNIVDAHETECVAKLKQGGK